METPEVNLPSFIIDGTCKKDEKVPCNIGYACDGCPYNKKVICFCCEKEFEEKDITKIVAGIDKVTGSVERRFICKKCNHLPEYQKTPMDIIREGEENENIR